jgi:ferredoxin
MAFRDGLAALGAHRVRFVDTTSEPRPDLKDMIAGPCPGGVVYCCGPASLIELRQSWLSITVGPETTLLQAIRDAGVEIASDWEGGYCGTCETAVLDGVPDHRGVVLSRTEHAAGRTIMSCVSRARKGESPSGWLDLGASIRGLNAGQPRCGRMACSAISS